MLRRISPDEFGAFVREHVSVEPEQERKWGGIIQHILHELPPDDQRFSQLRDRLFQLSTADNANLIAYYDQLVRAIDALAGLFPGGTYKGVGPLLWKHELGIKEQRIYLLRELELADRTLPIEEQRFRMRVLQVAERMAKLVRAYQEQLANAA